MTDKPQVMFCSTQYPSLTVHLDSGGVIKFVNGSYMPEDDEELARIDAHIASAIKAGIPIRSMFQRVDITEASRIAQQHREADLATRQAVSGSFNSTSSISALAARIAVGAQHQGKPEETVADVLTVLNKQS